MADLELNLPFERKADPSVDFRGRFLLFHGLNDSAYVWHDFAEALAARGFDVRAVLFEGHGSTPEDMLTVSSDSWMRAARRHADLYSDVNTPLYLGGFSMGAVMATLLALERDDLAGLFLVSPAYHSQLNGYLRWSGLYKMFRPWVFGGMILEDNPIKYNSIPVNSGWQFYRLTRLLKRRWDDHRIDLPVLMVATENDSVVDVDVVRRLFTDRFTDPRKHLMLYTDQPVEPPRSAAEAAADPVVSAVEVDEPAPVAARSAIERRTSRYPQRRIVSASHLGLMYEPANTLFGERGRVLVCNGNEYPIFMACMRATDHWFGAQHAASPDGVPMARATYNPDFATVLQRFDRVFASTPPE